jgi:ubiquinone/menaquinone biosynthesis C-methylase UbiE/uncharacterized protein YbaR (Trm112 family)
MNNVIIPILQCPVKKTTLRLSTAAELAVCNAHIANGDAQHLDGSPVQQPLSAALTNADNSIFYGIYEGDILVLLPILAIKLDENTLPNWTLTAETQAIKAFYDEIGWEKNADNHFTDALRFEDLRPIMRRYIHRCHLRLGKFIDKSGQFMLDIASGPIQYDEYLSYSEGYEYRICADISMPALLQARQRIGREKGIFILCDITNLPFQADVCDAFVSLHTVYHVAAEQQLTALSELNRVLKPQKTGVVVYSWGIYSVLMSFLQPRLLWKNWRHIFSPRQSPLPFPTLSADSTFYFYAHSPRWFDDYVRPKFNVELASWRAIATPVARRFVKPWLLGRPIMRFLFLFESLFPRFFGRYGQYPIFIFKK